MSSGLLEGTRRAAGSDPGQPPLFDDLRRAEPGPERSPESVAPGPVLERGERGPRSGGDRLMLEEHLERIWAGLLAAGTAECPVCEATLEIFGGQGECGSCGAVLA